MDIIDLVREVGKEMQKDPRYLRAHAASDACDKDQALQEAIGEFNLKRMAINNESQKDVKNEAIMQRLNFELREVYAKIMANPNMVLYNEAKQDMDQLLSRISSILSQCAEGGDPDTVDYIESGCSGNCGSCGGCG
ncbi:YlbF family regulator [Hydrogeniiclostridium mannosilyticum]|uniref:YlbF family regulator n=1 Tax=Hydrogeniiclostridium mannosilyticum TaxID=2764322 RepID=UPI0018A9FD30|nr:YlbF family regulator [Hydrogeniiclostridium mannosilyticum]